MIKIFKQKNNKKISFMKFPWNKGVTLVETLIAISIFSVSILGLMSFLSEGISNTNYAKNKIVAGYLAQEGIEYIRNMRDPYIIHSSEVRKNWNEFVKKITDCKEVGCGFDNSVYSFDGNGALLNCEERNCNLFIENGNYNVNQMGSDSGFIRRVWGEKVTGKEVKIYSEVSWTKGSGSYNVLFSTILFNWIENNEENENASE